MKIKSKIITLAGCLTAIIGLSFSGALFASDVTVYNNGNSSATAGSSSLMNPGSELFQSLLKTIEGNENLYNINSNQLVPLPSNGPWTSTQGAQCIQYIWNANSTLCFALVTSNGTSNVYEYACESYDPSTGTFNGMWNPSPLSLNISLDNLAYFEPIFDSTGVNVTGSICLSPTDVSITGLGLTGLTQLASNSDPMFDGNNFASVSTLGWTATAGSTSLLNLYLTDAAGNNYFLNVPSSSMSGKYNAVSTPNVALGNSPLPWINSNQQTAKAISSETGETSGFVMSPYVNAGTPVTVNSGAALYNNLASEQYITPQNVLCSVLQNSVTGQYSVFTWMNDNNQDQWFDYPSFVSNTLPQITSIQSNPNGIGGTYTINNNITYQLTGNSLTANQAPWDQNPNLQDSSINLQNPNSPTNQVSVVDVQKQDGTYGAPGNYTIWTEQNSQWATAPLGYSQILSSCMPWGSGNAITSLAPYWNSDGTPGRLLASSNSTDGSSDNINLFNPAAGGAQWTSVGIEDLSKQGYPSSVFANYEQDGTGLSSMLALITNTSSPSPSDLQFAYVDPTSQKPTPDTWTDTKSIPWSSGYNEAGFVVNSAPNTASSTLGTLMSSKSLESSPLKSGLIGDQNYSFDSNVKILSMSYLGKDSSGKPVTNIVDGNIQCIPLQNSPYKYSISFVTSDFNGVLNANDIKVESALESVADPSEAASANGSQSIVWANSTGTIGSATGQIYFYGPASNGGNSPSWSSNLAPSSSAASNWNNQNIVLGAVNWDADGNYDGMIAVTTPDNSTYNVYYLAPNPSYAPSSSTWESAGTLPSGFTPADILGFGFDNSENLSYITIANSIYGPTTNNFAVYQYNNVSGGSYSWNSVNTSGTSSSQNGDVTIQNVSYAGNTAGDALYRVTINGEALSSAMMFGATPNYATTFTTGSFNFNVTFTCGSTTDPTQIYVNGSTSDTLASEAVNADIPSTLTNGTTYTFIVNENITSLTNATNVSSQAMTPSNIYVNGSSTLTLADVMPNGQSLSSNQTYTVATNLKITSLQSTAGSTTSWGTVLSSNATDYTTTFTTGSLPFYEVTFTCGSTTNPTQIYVNGSTTTDTLASEAVNGDIPSTLTNGNTYTFIVNENVTSLTNATNVSSQPACPPNDIYVNNSSTLTLADVMLDGITSLNPNQAYTVTTMLDITSLQQSAGSTTNWGTVSSTPAPYSSGEVGLNGLEFTVTTGAGASYTARAFPLAGFTSYTDYTDGVMKIAPREFSFLWEGPQFIGNAVSPTVTITENAHTYNSDGTVNATYPIKTYTATLPFFIAPTPLGSDTIKVNVSPQATVATFPNGVCALPFNVTIYDSNNNVLPPTDPLYNELSFYNYNSSSVYNLIGGSPLTQSDTYTAVIPASEMDVVSGYPKYGYSYTPGGSGREYYAIVGNSVNLSSEVTDKIDTYIISNDGYTLTTSNEFSINSIATNTYSTHIETVTPVASTSNSFIPTEFGEANTNYITEELSNIYPTVNGVVEFSPDYVLVGNNNNHTDGLCIILPEGLNPNNLAARYNLATQSVGLCYGVNEDDTLTGDSYWISNYSLEQSNINGYSYQNNTQGALSFSVTSSYSIEEAIYQICSTTDYDYFFDQYGNNDELTVDGKNQLSGDWNNVKKDSDMEIQINNTQPLPIYASSFLSNQNLGYTQISGVPNGGTISTTPSSAPYAQQNIGSGLFIPCGSESAPAVCNVLTTLATGTEISGDDAPTDANCLWFNQAYPIIEVYGYGIDNTQLFNNSLNFIGGLTCNRIFFNLANNEDLPGYSALNMLDLYWDNTSTGPTNAMIKTWGIEYDSALNVNNTVAEYSNSLTNNELWQTNGNDLGLSFQSVSSPLSSSNYESLLYGLSGTGEFGGVDEMYTSSNADSYGIDINNSEAGLSNSPLNYNLGFWLLNLNNPDTSVTASLTSVPTNFPSTINS